MRKPAFPPAAGSAEDEQPYSAVADVAQLMSAVLEPAAGPRPARAGAGPAAAPDPGHGSDPTRPEARPEPTRQVLRRHHAGADLTAEEVARLQRLVDEQELRVGPPAPSRSRLTELMAGVDVMVRVLGEVEAVRLPVGTETEEKLVPSRQRALEAISYLALRDSAVDREDLEISLFPAGANAARGARSSSQGCSARRTPTAATTQPIDTDQRSHGCRCCCPSTRRWTSV